MEESHFYRRMHERMAQNNSELSEWIEEHRRILQDPIAARYMAESERLQWESVENKRKQAWFFMSQTCRKTGILNNN